MKTKKKISIIVPCFNEEEAIPLFHKEISKVADKMPVDFEFIFIDDGSKDKTLDVIKKIRTKDKRVRFISFSRNFGKEAGMYAGLENSDFRLMTRQMVDTILSMKEKNRYTKGIYNFIGFKTKWIEFETPDRAVGTSKFPLKKLFEYALQGIVAFSVEPLKIPIKLAILNLFISFVWFIVIIVMLFKHMVISTFLSLGCLIVFLFGINLLMVGILAKYISESY